MKKVLFLVLIITGQFANAEGSGAKYGIEKLAEKYITEAEQFLTADSMLFRAYLDTAFYFIDKYELERQKSKALITNGVFYYNRGQYAKAITTYLLALDETEKSGDTDLEAKIYDNIGLVNYAMQDYEKAVENSLKALDINKINGDKVILIRNHNNLGINYYMLGDYEKAIIHYKESLKLSEENEDLRGVITSLSNIALVIAQQGDLEGAQKYYLEALDYCEELNDPLTTGYVLLNVGSNYTLLNQPEKGIESLHNAQEIGNENGFLEVVKYCHLYLGEAYAAKGDFEQSFEERKLYDAMKDSVLTIETEIEVAEIETKYETEEKSDRIVEQDIEITAYSERNKLLFILIGVISLTFLFFIARFLKKQKRLKQEKGYIDQQYQMVENENQELKYRLLKVSTKLEADRSSESKIIKYRKSSLSGVQREKYVNKLLNYMQETKPYLNADITPQDIAADLNITKHHLSEVLNINFGKNFYGFMNLYRVEKAKEIIINDKENITMLAVAFDAGFNSKTSFNRAFKEITGITPSQFKVEQKGLD